MGVMIVSFFALLWIVAGLINKAAFATSRRWWRTGLIWLALIAVLHIDVVVGYFAEYRPAVKASGNGSVVRRVTANGILDRTGHYLPSSARDGEPGLALFSAEYPFTYVEMSLGWASRSRLVGSRGKDAAGRWANYVNFHRAAANTPACEKFAALPDADQLRVKYSIPRSECITGEQTVEPISRYEVTEIAERKLNAKTPFLVTAHESLLLDHVNGDIVALCRTVTIQPQISRLIAVQLLNATHDPPCHTDAGFWRLINRAVSSSDVEER